MSIRAYYTGNFKSYNNNDNNDIFLGSSYNHYNRLWKPDILLDCLWNTNNDNYTENDVDNDIKCDKNYLYFGGVIIRINTNSSDNDINGDLYRNKISSSSYVKATQAKQSLQKRLLKDDTLSLLVLSSSSWDIFMTDNYANSNSKSNNDSLHYDFIDSFKPMQGKYHYYTYYYHYHTSYYHYYHYHTSYYHYYHHYYYYIKER